MELRRVRKKKKLSLQVVEVATYDRDDDFPWSESPPDYDPEHPPDSEQIDTQPRDGYIDRVKSELIALFASQAESVFYQRQLQVMFEKDYFHWITVRALTELVEEGVITAESLALPGTGNIKLYRANGYRYWKRDADEIVKLVSQFSESSFTYALGAHGEMMFDAALPTGGFMPKGTKVRSYGGVEWTESKHDLDRVFERDGIVYGTEIKNTLSYVDKGELEIKVRMSCWLFPVPAGRRVFYCRA